MCISWFSVVSATPRRPTVRTRTLHTNRIATYNLHIGNTLFKICPWTLHLATFTHTYTRRIEKVRNDRARRPRRCRAHFLLRSVDSYMYRGTRILRSTSHTKTENPTTCKLRWVMRFLTLFFLSGGNAEAWCWNVSWDVMNLGYVGKCCRLFKESMINL